LVRDDFMLQSNAWQRQNRSQPRQLNIERNHPLEESVLHRSISLPGNSSLPVSFGCRFVVESRGDVSRHFALSDWDVEPT